MSNGNVLERLWKLQTQVNRLVLEGKRDPEEVIAYYQKVLEKTLEWKTWKTIKLGTLKNADEIRRDILLASKKSITNWANYILGRQAFKISEVEYNLDLVIVSVQDLGFKSSASYGEICKRAKEFGLGLCPAEVGPQLFLQWDGQLDEACVVVAMDAIATDTDRGIFVLRFSSDKQTLHAEDGRPDNRWSYQFRFVFVRL